MLVQWKLDAKRSDISDLTYQIIFSGRNVIYLLCYVLFKDKCYNKMPITSQKFQVPVIQL